jgi:hypothetical protein
VNLVDTKRYISEGTYFGPKYKDFVFRKKEGVGYPFAKLHVSRTPFGFEDETWERVPPDSAVVLHYQFCDPSKLIKKQAWYMVNERVFSGKSVNELNSKYSAVLTIQEEVSLVPIIWQKIPRLPSPSSDDWHLNEVLKIVSSHGFEFFDGLIFWDSVEFLEIKRILTGKRSFVFLKIANRLLRYWAKKSHQLKSQGDFMQKDFAEDIYTIQRWPLITSWDPNSKYGLSIQSRMMEVWVEFECDLLQELISSEIEGAVCEFGVFQGQTFKPLVDLVTREDPQRLLVGFDSFEGLPEPDVINDLIGWHSGQFACDKETVRTYLGNDLPNLRLVKGWFSESLADVASYGPGLEKVSFARIDSDLYASAMDVLNFLDTRLVPGSILIFDEWSFDLNKSETKAFVDWQSTTKSALTPVLIATSGFRVAFQMNDPGKTSERFTMVDTLRRQLANWKSFYLQDKD